MDFNRLILAAAALLLAACAGPRAPGPSAGDCTTIRLWSNGWHANLAFAADILPDEHPIRERYPEAEYFLIGWGDRDFYMAENAGFLLGAKAALFPTSSVMQVFAADEPVEDRLWPAADLVDIAISRAGAARLADGLADTVRTGEAGRPVALGEGRVAGRSDFLAARQKFHLFYMCNHWTARRLREAGVPVASALSFTAPGLLQAVRKKTARACPEN